MRSSKRKYFGMTGSQVVLLAIIAVFNCAVFSVAILLLLTTSAPSEPSALVAVSQPSQTANQPTGGRVFPPTWTPTLSPRPTATLRPTKTPTPVSAMFSGAPEDYMPSPAEIPQGFELLDRGSMDLQPNGEGYFLAYQNTGRMLDFISNDRVNGAFGLMFTIGVAPNESVAKSVFEGMESRPNSQKIDLNLPNVDEYMAIVNEVTVPTSVQDALKQALATYELTARKKNVIVSVALTSLAPSESNSRPDAIWTEARDYVSLVIDKLNQEPK